MSPNEHVRTLAGRRRRLVFVAAGCCLAGLLLGLPGCRGSGEGEHEKPVSVRTAKAEKRSLRPSFQVIGTVLADPERQATLTAATSGLVDRLAVPEGAKVGCGELVVQLDERKARNDVQRAQAALDRLIAKPRPEELTQAKALVEKMRAAHKLAQTKFQKAQELRARNPELVPEVQLLDEERSERVAKADMDTAQAQLQLLEKGPREEQRREAQIEVEAARLQLEFCRVTAKFPGEVVELKARVGQRADVGTPLATLLDTSEVLVQARVPGNILAMVAQAIETQRKPLARIRCPSCPDVIWASDRGWLNQQTEAATGDVPIKLRVANKDHLLRVGMTVQVELLGAEVEDVAIPETAFTVNDEGQHVVTVIREGKAVPTEIELAPQGGQEVRAEGWVRVVKGLQAGDEVAVENGYFLPKGTPVTVLPPREAPGEQP